MHDKFALAKLQGLKPPWPPSSSQTTPASSRMDANGRIPSDEKNLDLPPPYTAGPGAALSENASGAPSQSFQPQNSHLSQHHAPQQQVSTPKLGNLYQSGILGLYHTSHTDLEIAASSESPADFYVGTHGVFSSKADVTLHSSLQGAVHANSTTVGTVDFESFSKDFTIHLYDPSGSGQPTGATRVEKAGWINVKYSFTVRLPSTGEAETFCWRHSSSAAVASLQGSSSGWECMSSNGQTVAVYARPGGMSVKKLGKFALAPRTRGDVHEGWGEGVEGLVLMALLGILESERRARRRNNNMV